MTADHGRPEPGIPADEQWQSYDHARFELRRNFLRFLMRTIGFTLLARISRVEGRENIPLQGPVIVMINHIAYIDPLAVMNVFPRNIVPLAKKEVYGYPVVSIFPRLWDVILVDRDGGDRQALRQSELVLKAGESILVAPEGTRSPALQEGRDGVSFLAVRTGAPILPTAVDQTEGFPTYPFSKRWREPGAVIRFGQPFTFHEDLGRPDRHLLRRMTDDAMIALARLLPEHRRGVYADRVQENLDTIRFR
jgi:1-acyl-sn-glycerol-3-phosphate acyltransferase